MKKNIKNCVFATLFALTLTATLYMFPHNVAADEIPTEPTETTIETEEPTIEPDYPVPYHDDGDNQGCG